MTFDPSAVGTAEATAVDSGGAALGAVVCPSSSQCTAVDDQGREVTFDPRSPEDPIPVTVDGGQDLIALACPSASQCTAMDSSGREVTFNPTAPGSPTAAAIGSLASFLACPSVSQCTAVDNAGREVTFDPVTPGNPTAVTVDPQTCGGHGFCTVVTALACAAESQCVVVDSVGREVTFDPTSPGSPAPTIIDNSAGGPFGNLALACPSRNQCTAVDGDGHEVTFDPTAPGTPNLVVIDGTNSLHPLACPSISQCTALDGLGRVLTFDPNAPGTPTPAMLSLSWPVELMGVACPVASQCTAVDAEGREVTFNPTVPGNPDLVTVDANSTLDTVACPSISQCTAVDQALREVTFDPSAPGSPTPVTISSGVVDLGSVACPSTTQCSNGVGDGVVTFNPTAPRHLSLAAVASGVFTVACPSVSQCTAVDGSANEVTFNPRAPGKPAATNLGVGFVQRGALACPSAAQCTAVDGAGQEVTFNPTAPGRPMPVTVDPTNNLEGLACPSVLQCTAVDTRGREVTFDPANPRDAAPVAIAGANALIAIDCNSVRDCVAVDNRGNGFAGVAPTESPGPPTATTPPAISGTTQQGHTLSVRPGVWTDNPSVYSYQWQDCDSHGNNCTPIFGAGHQTYTLKRSDVGHTIRVQETATNAAGPSVPASSRQTSIVTPAPPKALVGRVKAQGKLVAVPIHCEGAANATCLITLTLTAIEPIKSGAVAVPTAGKRTTNGSGRRPVVLGGAKVRVASGQTKTVFVRLNAAGKRLLSRHHRLQAMLAVSQSGRIVFRGRVTFESPTTNRKAHK